MSRFFDDIRQIAYVVPDIIKAMDLWTRMGVGPWFVKENICPTEFVYYGKQSKLPNLSIALANSGNLQIELIQQNNQAPTLYLDSIKLNNDGEVAQHIAFWTKKRFSEWCGRLERSGFTQGHAGRIGSRGRFAYYIHPDLPSAMIEISESTGGKAEYFENVREASLNWDGTNPIRPVSVVAS